MPKTKDDKSLTLTPQQNRFALLYSQGELNATECARLAGYKSPSAQGARLLTHEGIRRVVESHQKNLIEASGWTESRVIKELAEVHRLALADQAWTPAINALKQIGDWLGMAHRTSTSHVKVDVAFEDLLSRALDVTPGPVRLSQDSRTGGESDFDSDVAGSA